ncbi:MAG: hypothetical protein HC910_08505 [Spirulinaceae cyanobacterium SM2_1_0]|nr:hypothetical protein [Spirulinaceae cyanobacterium SM2_1_0]
MFELWHRTAAPSDPTSKPVGQHLLICIFDYGQSLRAAEQLGEYLLPLLLHRHKLLWLVHRSQQLRQNLQQGYTAAGEVIRLLEAKTQSAIADLDGLNEQWLRALNLRHTYTQGLGELQANLQVIAAHLKGYRRERQRLQALDPQSDLSFLQQFERQIVKQDWRSLQQDSDRLKLGIPCLENAAKMAEGAIAIEQLKSQQQLARTMVAASASLGATTAAAVSISPHLATSPESPWQNLSRSGSSFLLSLIAGGLVGWGLWRYLPRFTRWNCKIPRDK